MLAYGPSSPYIGHFVQADTIIPDQTNPQSWDRYAYVSNNPLRYTDPTGHRAACEDYSVCKVERSFSKLRAVDSWKKIIKDKFGIDMKDGPSRKWSITNLLTAHNALNMINDTLNGHLKSMVGGTVFTVMEGGNQYYGQTKSTGVDFHTFDSNTKIPLINFLHETGHLLDAVPATKDVFSGSLPADPSWVKDGYVNSDLLLNKFSEPVQAKPMNEPYSRDEYWADGFANYVTGNINLERSAGMDMATDVASALQPYINP